MPYRNERPLWLRTLGISTLILVPLWGVVWWDMQQTTLRERAETESALHGVTQVSAQSLRGGLRLMDVLLLQLRDLWSRNPGDFDRSVHRIQQEWGGRGGVHVSVIGAHGRVKYTTINPAAVGLDVSEREPFRQHKAKNAQDVLRIGSATPTLVAKNLWFVPFSRPIFSATGEFQGVISILMDPDFLTELYGPIGLGQDHTVSLLRSDEELVLRSVPNPSAPGRLLSQLPKPRQLFDTGEPGFDYQSLPASGTTLRVSSYDNVRRLYAWAKLPEFHLVLVMGRSQSSLWELIRLYEKRYITFGALVSSLLVLAIYWNQRLSQTRLRALHQQSLQIEQLGQSQTRLQASQNALRELNAQLISVKEQEGKRISQEIHDELGQRLTVLRMDLAMLERTTRDDFEAKLPPYIAHLKKDVDAVLAIVRDIASRLRPVALDVSLPAAIEGLVAEYGKSQAVRCDFRHALPADLGVDDTVGITAYRVVQEALTNAVRHGHPHHVGVRMGIQDNFLEIFVTDDGIGFDVKNNPRRGLGLSGIRERVAALGGSVDIHCPEGKGTVVHALLPLSLPVAPIQHTENP